MQFSGGICDIYPQIYPIDSIKVRETNPEGYGNAGRSQSCHPYAVLVKVLLDRFEIQKSKAEEIRKAMGSQVKRLVYQVSRKAIRHIGISRF